MFGKLGDGFDLQDLVPKFNNHPENCHAEGVVHGANDCSTELIKQIEPEFCCKRNVHTLNLLALSKNS